MSAAVCIEGNTVLRIGKSARSGVAIRLLAGAESEVTESGAEQEGRMRTGMGIVGKKAESVKEGRCPLSGCKRLPVVPDRGSGADSEGAGLWLKGI